MDIFKNILNLRHFEVIHSMDPHIPKLSFFIPPLDVISYDPLPSSLSETKRRHNKNYK